MTCLAKGQTGCSSWQRAVCDMRPGKQASGWGACVLFYTPDGPHALSGWCYGGRARGVGVGVAAGLRLAFTVVPDSATERGGLGVARPRITEAILLGGAGLDGLLEDGLEYRTGPIRSVRECFAT